MDFDDAKKKMSPIHKLHTARDLDGETIFYKKPYSAKRIIVVTDEENVFELNKVTHITLSECGLLIQNRIVNVDKMNPFPLKLIEDIIIET